MEDELTTTKENVSKMFAGKTCNLTADEELALHIIHRFNIDRETIETMPAIEEHVGSLFSKVIDK